MPALKQEQDASGEPVQITRTASQQIMHHALTTELDRQSMMHGRFYYDSHHCITNITAWDRSLPDMASVGGLWLAHNGADATAITRYLTEISRNFSDDPSPERHLLLNLATKGRLELTALQLNPALRPEDPPIITELAVELIEDFTTVSRTEEG